MSQSDKFEFVNRTEELSQLRSRVFSHPANGTVTFLRGPSGFGKSRLTERLLEDLDPSGPVGLIVDPSIRSKGRSDRVYAWYFIQRIAEAANQLAMDSQRLPCSFHDYVRKRKRWKANWKQLYESLKGAASLSGLIKVGIDFAESIFKIGKYSPQVLLNEDGTYASELAAEYMRFMAERQPMLLVIRESQNMDPESLAFLLALADNSPRISALLEYTSPTHTFSTEHQKIIFESTLEVSSLAVFDLLKLNAKEFRYLLNKYVPSSQTIEAISELQWDGNLRIIRELKYRITSITGAQEHFTFDLKSVIAGNVLRMPPLRRVVLAIVAVHIEPIPRSVLSATVLKINPHETRQSIEASIHALKEDEAYITINNENVSFIDEDLIDAVSTAPSMASTIKLVEVKLRDHYLQIIKDSDFSRVRMHFAIRQAVILCVQTKDIYALRNLVRMFDAEVRRSNSQSLFINIISDVIVSQTQLSISEKIDITAWASTAAYESGDYATTVKLLDYLPGGSPFDIALQACCYGETNCLKEALKLAEDLQDSRFSYSNDNQIAGRILQCLNLFAIGRKAEAKSVHQSLRTDECAADSPLYGYVLRFTEVVEDFPECIDDVLGSSKVFRRHGMLRSAAYSQMAAAMHMAYAGQLRQAGELVRKADVELKEFIHDRQLSLNNRVVIELMSRRSDARKALGLLTDALISPGDDFTRLVLHNNCLICFSLIRDEARANHTIEVIERILDSPGFGNRDVIVTACFNAWTFCIDTGQLSKGAKFKEMALALDLETICYPGYWKYRFGLSHEVPDKFSHLLALRFHPEYLSHWLIDLDGLNVLKAKSS